jgi:hypothetical protein
MSLLVEIKIVEPLLHNSSLSISFQPLPANIRWLTVANTLAYCGTATITGIKWFKIEAPEAVRQFIGYDTIEYTIVSLPTLAFLGKASGTGLSL